MIIIERTYDVWDEQLSVWERKTERRAFPDDDYADVQKFIDLEGDYKYTKL